MFLNSLIQRNRPFLEAAIYLHQQGQIPANSCVLDLDAMRLNASLFSAAAAQHGLKTYAMTKQFGRVAPALHALAAGGIDTFVAVDMECARPIHRAGLHLGHIGHLVQIPRHEAVEAAAFQAAYWTVFSHEKASEAASAARSLGREQALLARIQAPGDTFYMGHEGGFNAADVVEVAGRLNDLDGAHFAGITSFPALLFDEPTGTVRATHNLHTLEVAAERLASAGYGRVEINAPGTTSIDVLPLLAAAGATQVEPGNGLTGTTPLHAVRELPELPAVLYLSEISHEVAGKAYCFGGGLYIDPVFSSYPVTGLVGNDLDSALANRLEATLPPAAAIDYYGILTPGAAGMPEPGTTVIFGFRQQAFVTRSLIAPVSGVSTGQPKVEGIWTPFGTPWSPTYQV